MFHSILYQSTDLPKNTKGQPTKEEQKDLKLDQILCYLEKYSLWDGINNVFLSPLDDENEIRYRQDVMKDFSKTTFRKKSEDFSKKILELEKERLKLKDEQHSQKDLMNCSRYLYLADSYCGAVEQFFSSCKGECSSFGMTRFFQEFEQYKNGPKYTELLKEVSGLYKQFEKIHFCMLVKDGKFKIRPYEGQKALDDEVKELFSRFDQSDHLKEEVKEPQLCYRHHIDTAVLNLLSHWYPKEMQLLREFASEHYDFLEEGILSFAREIYFYISWYHMIDPLLEKGLPFCTPALSKEEKKIYCEDGFDLALAIHLYEEGENTVTNSFFLKGKEKIIVVTGPNQGGKTTFARLIGQIFYLSSLGYPVPGTRAQLSCFDHIYTHFNQKEDLEHFNGKLKDDIVRLQEIEKNATAESILIINEIYASTTLLDAVFLGEKMMEYIKKTGCIAVVVTFLDELAKEDGQTVSMMSTVDENNPSIRNYKMIRKPADGLAYAECLAKKYRLNYEELNRRLKR